MAPSYQWLTTKNEFIDMNHKTDRSHEAIYNRCFGQQSSGLSWQVDIDFVLIHLLERPGVYAGRWTGDRSD